ncbi:ABC transporter substrate-binding protein [Paenibacillus sp. TRM 82003]|nr:ABC transporter substrate-binding protein [Paenibacillus sp. TRM 82003]
MLHFKSASLDPHNDFTSLRVGVTETLVKLGDDLALEAGLATEWTALDDVTWQFQIREGVTFHDGAKLDAAAAKASLERGLQVSKRLSGLKIASIEADGQTLTIVTSEPNPSLPSELVNPYASIVHTAAEETMGKDAFNEAPVGTGPFRVTSFTPNLEVRLARYDAYWNGPANVEEAVVTFNEDANVRALALQSGEADIAWGLPAESIEVVEQAEALRVESIDGLRVHFILFNQRKPEMQDRKVRQAVDLLVNRESAAADVMLGNATPANGPFNPNLPFGSDKAPVRQNIEEAKRLLTEAGYAADADGKLSKDGKPLTLELITYGARPELPLIAQLLQSDAARAGVTIKIKSVEDVDNYLAEQSDWDIATYSNLTAPRGDGGFFLNSAFLPDGALNPGGIDLPELTALIERLNAESEAAARNALIGEAAAVLAREAPHSYVVYPNVIVGVNERVMNWSPNRSEFYMLTNVMDVK